MTTRLHSLCHALTRRAAVVFFFVVLGFFVPVGICKGQASTAASFLGSWAVVDISLLFPESGLE